MMISQDWLVNYAGYKKALTLTSSRRGRGLFRSVRSNVIVAVVATGVFVIDPVLGVTQVTTPDTLETEIGEVFMDENLNSQVAIVDGLNVYILNLTKPYTLTKQTGGVLDGDPPQLIPNYVDFHDTFFLIGNREALIDGQPNANSSQWFAYSYASATTISMTTQLALQTKPDSAIAIKSIPSQANNVLVFGTTVCEIHTNVGGTQNYRRQSTVNVDFGCRSVNTIASSDKYIVWLGVNEDNNPVIMAFQGQSAQPISTDGINVVLESIKFPGQSTAYFTRHYGHLVYVLTFSNALDNLTLAYDFDTQKFFHLSDQYQNHHPAIDTVYFNDKVYFLSERGELYETSTNITVIDENEVTPNYVQYDTSLIYEIPRIRISECIRKADSGRFIVNSFTFTMEQGNDPFVTDLSIMSGLQNPIITEDAFTPPNVDVYSQGNVVLVAEHNTGSQTTSDVAPYLAPATLVYIPRVDVTISKDSGITFGSTVSHNLNPIGKRQNIITFGNMGRANDLTICLKFLGRSSFTVSNGSIQVY